VSDISQEKNIENFFETMSARAVVVWDQAQKSFLCFTYLTKNEIIFRYLI
jgi:hypothetical protein